MAYMALYYVPAQPDVEEEALVRVDIVMRCAGVLITDEHYLTAAHCICQTPVTHCGQQYAVYKQRLLAKIIESDFVCVPSRDKSRSCSRLRRTPCLVLAVRTPTGSRCRSALSTSPTM